MSDVRGRRQRSGWGRKQICRGHLLSFEISLVNLKACLLSCLRCCNQLRKLSPSYPYHPIRDRAELKLYTHSKQGTRSISSNSQWRLYLSIWSRLSFAILFLKCVISFSGSRGFCLRTKSNHPAISHYGHLSNPLTLLFLRPSFATLQTRCNFARLELYSFPDFVSFWLSIMSFTSISGA